MTNASQEAELTPHEQIEMEERYRAGSLAFGMTSFQLVTVLMALLITGGVAFLGGILYSRQTDEAYSEEFIAFWEAWDIIEEDYYKNPPDEQDRVYAAISGLTSSMGDPYSSFSPPVQADQNREFLSGEFGGIGANVQELETGEVVITRAIEGNPAQKAGMLAGDIIIAVDGESVEGLGINETINLIIGDVGTEVKVTVRRHELDDDGNILSSEEIEFTLTRATIQRPVATSTMLDDVGYIYLSDFSAVATSQLERELTAILAENPRAVILDMRGNGGGLLSEAVSVSDLFLPNGLVLSERDRNTKTDEYFSQTGEIGENIPLIILMDGGTASASEIVAGALQDRDRAILIGQQSYGKASVQELNALSGGGELRITVAGWYTPDEQEINGVGLTPDIVVDGDQFDANGNDLILNAALEHIDSLYPKPESEATTAEVPVFGW